MKRFLPLLFVCAALLLIPVDFAQGASNLPPALTAWLGKIKDSDRGEVELISDGALEAFLPGFKFYSVHFPQYPVAVFPPQPLLISNVLAVSRDGEVTQMISDNELMKFVKKNEHPGAATPQQIAVAWFMLSTPLLQDGYFSFSSLQNIVVSNGNPLTVAGSANVTGGGNGTVSVEIELDEKGSLSKATVTPDIRAGIRPICQATKLLDNDPVVRKMAEQDLLVMGKAAKPYLDQRRALASPELQKAIDRIWQRIVAEGR
jgi:hypothetical protein